ncbi:hypothetical protein ACF1CG_34720 [Streptomyces sp. NPDC014773]|uniref:hypothetical protein n=1 Tax=Streptomyces sp. NPDC014773 TaxID=3364908 RepID=UPI0036F5A1D1
MPSDAEDLAELERVAADVIDGASLPVRAWVVGGTAAGVPDGPPVGGQGGLPIGGEGGLLELRGWALAEHWFGYGVTATADGPRRIVILARRAFTPPPGVGWVALLRETTGWTEPDRCSVDWAATETALGTALPGDYKNIVDAFGRGSFDEYLDLLVPGALGTDLVSWGQNMARYADLYRPYPVHPAPGGVLTWGISEQELTFHWLTGPADPDDWPVLVQYVGGEWQRFDCGTGEFVLRLLTDRTPPFGFPPSAGPFPHWFASWELPER